MTIRPWLRGPRELAVWYRLRVWWMRRRCEHRWSAMTIDGMEFLRVATESSFEMRRQCRMCGDTWSERVTEQFFDAISRHAKGRAR